MEEVAPLESNHFKLIRAVGQLEKYKINMKGQPHYANNKHPWTLSATCCSNCFLMSPTMWPRAAPKCKAHTRIKSGHGKLRIKLKYK